MCRLLAQFAYAPVLEFPLGDGGRADVVGLSPKGALWIVEVKSCVEDFVADRKWTRYLEYCDAFWFACPETFPTALLPEDAGVIVADGYGGAMIRQPATRAPISGARRRAMLIGLARLSALRVVALPDPTTAPGDSA